MAAHFIHAPWDGLNRRPLLTAMTVFSIGFAAAGLVIWRCIVADPARPACQPLFRMLVTRESLRREENGPREENPLRDEVAVQDQSSMIGIFA